MDQIEGGRSEAHPLGQRRGVHGKGREKVAEKRGRARTLFIELGSPWENGYVESFNGISSDARASVITLKPAIRDADGMEILLLTLTARGKPAGSELADVLEWLDMGRRWVVRGFADFTSQKMHTLWKRST